MIYDIYTYIYHIYTIYIHIHTQIKSFYQEEHFPFSWSVSKIFAVTRRWPNLFEVQRKSQRWLTETKGH